MNDDVLDVLAIDSVTLYTEHMTTTLPAHRVHAARSVGNQDWLSANARALVTLAVFAGFDCDELLKRVAMRSRNTRTVTLPTVVAVLDQMERDS